MLSAPLSLHDLDALSEIFRTSEKPPERFLVGMEAEKFGLRSNGAPLAYEGRDGVEGVFEKLIARGWSPGREAPEGPVLWLHKNSANITLEPAAQFELSGTPFRSVHDVTQEVKAHFLELAEICGGCDLHWVHLGFHPLARHAELPDVPKQRYPIMRRYLPTRGARGLDMMRRTATVQVNFDYSSEDDAIFKLSTLLRLTPFVQAMTLNAPFFEGQPSQWKSERLDVWLNMDPDRSGLIRRIWQTPVPRYRDYVEWALDAGMFLFKRDGQLRLNTGQTFRDFLQHGFEGEFPTQEDWKLHLGTLFPEVRLKTTLEVRGVDSLPPPLAFAVVAFLTGLVYDANALSRARELTEGLDYESAVSLQHRVKREGLRARFGNTSVLSVAESLLDLARAGLDRRSALDPNAVSESGLLAPLEQSVGAGEVPADAVLRRYRASGASLVDFLRQDATLER